MKDVAVEDLPLSPTLIWCGTPLFNDIDGLQLIEYCEKNNIAVLGMEGFKICEDKMVPDMNYIADFSSSLNEENFFKDSLWASRKIITSIDGADILLEFVLVNIK